MPKTPGSSRLCDATSETWGMHVRRSTRLRASARRPDTTGVASRTIDATRRHRTDPMIRNTVNPINQMASTAIDSEFGTPT
jgi:hypothetical protein